MTTTRPKLPTVARRADEDSLHGQRWSTRLVRVELVLLVGVAVAAELVPEINEASKRAMGVVAAVMLFGAAAAPLLRRFVGFDRLWFEGRAVAESIKTLTWRYVMRVPPFDRKSADTAYDAGVSAVLDTVTLGPRWREIAGEPIVPSDQMRAVRDEDWEQRRLAYIAERVDDQIAWYGGRSDRNRTRGTLFELLLLGVQAAAVVAGVALALGRWNLVGVATTIAASVTAWSQFRRYKELELSYGLAHDELVAIRSRMIEASASGDFAESVRDSEGAISREHTIWAAKSLVSIAPVIDFDDEG